MHKVGERDVMPRVLGIESLRRHEGSMSQALKPSSKITPMRDIREHWGTLTEHLFKS